MHLEDVTYTDFKQILEISPLSESMTWPARLAIALGKVRRALDSGSVSTSGIGMSLPLSNTWKKEGLFRIRRWLEETAVI